MKSKLYKNNISDKHYHRVVECSIYFYVIGQIDLSPGKTTAIRSGELHFKTKSPVPHNLTEFVNNDAVEVEIASS